MQVNNIKPNNNNVSYKGLDGRNIIKNLGDSDSLLSTVVLESFVTGGRGINAYQRGGQDELRERFIDDVVSAVFWMKGVDMFNSLGDKLGKRFLKLPTTEFDVGKDALRTPFKNLSFDQKVKLKSEDAANSMIKKLAAFKFTKIISATLLSTSVIGFIMPKINQKITEKLIQQRKMDKQLGIADSNTQTKNNYDLMKNHSFEEFNKRITGNKTQSFKGSFIDNMTQVSHALENHTICKMLTNDAGIITGRTMSARNKDEGLEYLFRDTSSLFFYFASTPLIYSGLQKLMGVKNLTEIDPVAAQTINENLKNQLNCQDSMPIEEFKKKTLGQLSDKDKNFIEKLPFKSDVISLKELEKHIQDEEIFKRAEAMAKLQPEQAEVGGVLTKQQVMDVYRNGSITQSEFMKRLYKDRFSDKVFDKYRYISMDKITKFRDNIDKYVLSIIDTAKKENNGMVNIEFLEKINKKSYKLSAGFRTIAMSISALALGFAIPKLQYAITEHRTGSKSAPMFREYEKQ